MVKKIKSKLNNASAEVIENNILKENPLGLPDDISGLVMSTTIPEMRKIQFLNGRDPGHELMFHYHSKTHPLKHYTLYHGAEYDLPVEVIEHLESCAEPVYAYRQGQSGHPEMYRKSSKYIFQCKTVKRMAA